MDSLDLTAAQGAALFRQVAQHRAYGGRLRARRVELRFPDGGGTRPHEPKKHGRRRRGTMGP